MRLLRTIQGAGRKYSPNVKADAAAFERDYGSDKANIARLVAAGAISTAAPTVRKNPLSDLATPKKKAAPRRTRTTKKKTASKKEAVNEQGTV